MAIEWITRVKGSADKSNARKYLVFLALADYANHEGLCWPSIASIADWAGCGAKQARRYLRELIEDGYVEVVKRGGGTRITIDGKTVGIPNRYRIVGSKLVPSLGREGMEVPSQNDEEPSHTGEVPSHKAEEPSLKTGGNPSLRTVIKNPQEEPSTIAKPNGKRALQNAVRKALEDEFTHYTALVPPIRKSEAAELWWQPLREVAVLADWQEDIGKWLLFEAIQRLERNGMTISSPKSVIKTVRAIRAERDRGALKRLNEPKGFDGLRVWLGGSA